MLEEVSIINKHKKLPAKWNKSTFHAYWICLFSP